MNHYRRLTTLEIPPVLHAIKSNWGLFHYWPHRIKLMSLRLRTFAEKGTTCSVCGLPASHFAIERHNHVSQSSSYHLNLWGIDQEGKEILFTHDHTLARALGGKDSMTNTTTMCFDCNMRKSIDEGKIAKERADQKRAKIIDINSDIRHNISVVF